MSWSLVETLIATSLLMLLVLLIRRPFARIFGAQAAYALWLIPILRTILPAGLWDVQLLPPAPVLGDPSHFIISESLASTTVFEVGALLAGAWITGAVAILAIGYWRHRSFVTGAIASSRRLAVPHARYPVLASRTIDGPMAAGLIRPIILVPEDFLAKFTTEQQRLALLHEELHHRRGDLWASAAALLFLAAHWFNPIAYLAIRAWRRDMEAACDAQLVQEIGREKVAAYADTIIRCANGPVPISLCALTTLDELKRRLNMLKFDYGPLRRATGLAVAGIVAAGGIAAANPGPAEQAHEIKKIEIRKDSKDGKHEIRKMEKLAGRCSGEKVELSSKGGAGDSEEKIKLVLCAKDGESLIPALEKAATDIESKSDMPADRKADLLAQIKAKIAELR